MRAEPASNTQIPPVTPKSRQSHPNPPATSSHLPGRTYQKSHASLVSQSVQGARSTTVHSPDRVSRQPLITVEQRYGGTSPPNGHQRTLEAVRSSLFRSEYVDIVSAGRYTCVQHHNAESRVRHISSTI